MPKSVIVEWKLDSPEGVMKWLAERSILPSWNDAERRACFEPHVNQSAKRHFIEVLNLNSKNEVERIKCQLLKHPNWDILR